jgi:sugar phosphate isomerase/epimerase
MNRRNFIRKSVTGMAACYGLNGILLSEARAGFLSKPGNNNRIGIQLYSVREELAKDLTGSLTKLSDTGYAYAEAYGFNGEDFLGKRLKEINAILNDLGMQLSGTHCGTGILPADTGAGEWDYWRKSCNEMKAAGGERLIQSWLPRSNTLDDLKKLAEQFNRIGELCKTYGIKFGYHNHHSEFKSFQDSTVMDVLLQNTDPKLVFFQLDLGHAVNGGADILQYMQKYPKRFTAWHASDFKKGQGYTELGRGDVPYDTLMKSAKSFGLEDLTVEHEAGNDRFASCKICFDYLAGYSWTKAKKKQGGKTGRPSDPA